MQQNLDIQPCVDPKFVSNSHLQTILGYFAPSPVAPKVFDRWQIDLADGDALTARYYEGRSDTVIVLFHGLGGCADSSYMQRSARIALRQRHSVLLVNHRGAGEGSTLARKYYSANSAEDVSAVIREVRKRKPGRRVLIAGFSLSANVILNLLGGQSGSDQPDLAIVVNPPIDLLETSKAFTQGFNNVYDLHFVKLLKGEFNGRKDLPRFPKLCRLGDIDDLFTAPSNGFKNRTEYYDRCSSMHVVHKIKVPTLVLMAENDPFIPIDSFRKIKFSKSVRLHIEKTGGHMGYITKERTPLGDYRWLDYFMHEAFREMVRNSDKS